MILPIVAFGDPVLREVAVDITKDYEGFDAFLQNMWDTMYEADGVGLAAPQVGKAIRLFVVDASTFADEAPSLADFKKVFINAEIIEEFDEAIIRLHIPDSRYGASIQEAYTRVEEVKRITKDKPNIKIESSHELLDTQGIIDFLSQNTINCYFYDYMDGAGLASSPDYALAAKRPIAVTKSHQLRNFLSISPSICIEDNSLKDIILFGIEPLKDLYQLYSEENVIRDYELTIEKILEK